jgi:TolB-like protein/DNA-binding winged helix-turn-helix (wHTH) protein/tetratricopeptide (TPR) repeat protein
MVFEFGRFRLDRRQRSLMDDGGATVPLTGKAFDALAFLLEHAGQVVERDTLMDALWPDLVVEQNSLSQVVLALRRALGDGYIVTIKGRGYQFVAPVTAVPNSESERNSAGGPEPMSSAASPQPSARHAVALPGRSVPGQRLAILAILALTIAAVAGLATIRALRSSTMPPAAVDPSIAVLPFVNLSSDPEQEHFADGLSEELLNRLARSEGLRVIARTSSFAYKGQSPDAREVGAALGVGHVLEGSVRRSGDRLRVTAQLIDAEAGHHVWSEAYDRSFGDVFAIQDEIAGAVANALSVALGVREDPAAVGGTQNAEAYDFFVRALSVRNRNTPDDGLRAAELFREAIAKDPEFARAWAELAWALELAAIDSPRYADLMAQAREAVDRALALAPGMWEAHRERAFLHVFDREWEAAKRAVADARALAPPSEWPCLDVLVPVLGADVETYIACERGRREADPLSLDASGRLVIGLYEAGRDDEAYAEYERSRDLVGNRTFIEHFGLLLAWRSGDPELIGTHVRRIAGLMDPTPEPLARLVEVHADKKAALETLRISVSEPAAQFPSVQFVHALWLAHYGDEESAAEALRRGATAPESPAFDVLWMSDFAGIRRRPEFKEIVRELGLVEYWRESGDWHPLCRPRGEDDFECF